MNESETTDENKQHYDKYSKTYLSPLALRFHSTNKLRYAVAEAGQNQM